MDAPRQGRRIVPSGRPSADFIVKRAMRAGKGDTIGFH